MLAASERASTTIDVTPGPTITVLTIPSGYFRMPDGSFQPLSREQFLALPPSEPEPKLDEVEPPPSPLSEPTMPPASLYRARLKIVGDDNDPAE